MTGARKKPSAAPPKPKKAATRPPQAAAIGAFLAANPDYLREHPEVFDHLAPERRELGTGVVDMQGFLIERLRTDNARLQVLHDDLLAAGRANLTSQSRIHGAILSLLEARSFRELMEVTTTDLAIKLDVDVIVLGVENENGIAERSVSGVRLLQPGSVDKLMGTGRDVVLNADITGNQTLYGSATGLVASEALLRLHASPEAPTGILAMGARQPRRFDPDHGTELLGFLAQVLELSIRTWLGLPRS
ncbi:MAG: DUF484 family protein [Alphaproteobacteria bacterium]|nr:DUF484 family protein [Alphaproteobacteria bacterium]